MTPTPVDPVRAGRILEQVLELASELPFRSKSEKLEYPTTLRDRAREAGWEATSPRLS